MIFFLSFFHLSIPKRHFLEHHTRKSVKRRIKSWVHRNGRELR